MEANKQNSIIGNKNPSEKEVLLEVIDLVKTFPGVRALDHVSFELFPGEIHGLVGENGAGKSTLLKVLAGAHPADSGDIKLEGKPVRFRNPIEAQSAGICMQYQEKALFPELTVAENICVGNLGQFSGNRAFVDWKKINDKAREVLEWLHFEIDTTQRVSEITPQLQQIVQIARAIALQGKIIILDEPTASISFSEVDNLFAILQQLKSEGFSIIYVSHHLKEVFRITDRVTVLKDGQSQGTYQTKDIDEDIITRLMCGREILTHRESNLSEEADVVFQTRNLSTRDETVQDVSLEVHKGEILGVAGLVGSGKDMLARAISGSKDIASGDIVIEGQSFVPKNPKQVIRKGITVLPADRGTVGLVLNQTLNFNITLSAFNKIAKYGVVNNKKDMELSEIAATDVNLQYVTLRQPALSLSGGNQQRVMLARALISDSKIVVFDEPTQGVDVGAKQEIYKLIRSFAAEGGTVIMISSELPELLSMADNIAVMSKGRIVAKFKGEEASEELLLEKMIG